jgi:hypothetical protein
MRYIGLTGSDAAATASVRASELAASEITGDESGFHAVLKASPSFRVEALSPRNL